MIPFFFSFVKHNITPFNCSTNYEKISLASRAVSMTNLNTVIQILTHHRDTTIAFDALIFDSLFNTKNPVAQPGGLGLLPSKRNLLPSKCNSPIPTKCDLLDKCNLLNNKINLLISKCNLPLPAKIFRLFWSLDWCTKI